MKIAVMGGAGKVCLSAVQDFIEDNNVEEVLLADLNYEALIERQKFLNSNKLRIKKIDLNNPKELSSALESFDVCLNGSSHHFNIKVMRACIESKTNYTDFGGLFHWAREQLKLGEDFKRSGITGIVGSGSAPGIVNVMAKYGYDNLDTVETVRILDGIVNLNIEEYDFIPPYAIETLLDEYIMNPYEYIDGKFVELPPFSGEEVINFTYPIGEQTVFNTIHSEVATIPISFKNKGIKNVSFKLSLPKIFNDRLRFLVELGIGSKDKITVGNQEIIPRTLLAELIKQKQTKNIKNNMPHDDHKALKVEIVGTKNGKESKYILETVISPYKKWPHLSQGDFSVGYPAAVTTKLLGNNEIVEKGFFASEEVIPTDRYFEELTKRDIKVESNLIQNVCS